MFRLILKIFLAYWLAARVVLFVVNLEPHQRLSQSQSGSVLDSSMEMSGRLLIDAYENGRCSEAQALQPGNEYGLSIVAPDGHFLCGDPGLSNDQTLIKASVKSGTRMVDTHAQFQLAAIPLRTGSGKSYVVLMKNSYGNTLQSYGFFPGYTSITISLVVTLLLAFLVAMPIARLRIAARAIALGNLGARVRWGRIAEKVYAFNGRDDIANLVQDFNYMAERLQALAESQRLLLRDVSHELRSPLARLRVGLGLAQRQAPKAMLVHLDRIECEAKRLNDLIGQILSLSYLETIQEVELPKDVSLTKLIADILPDVQYEAAQHSCVITADISPDCSVRGDADLLRSAVENIVRNAIRFVPANGLIHVKTAPIEREGRMLSVIRISDNGPGIPDIELRSVLKPFYRADKSRYWRQSGFGIGLAIANRAAGVHGGTIAISNRPEGGLSVEMCFPSASYN